MQGSVNMSLPPGFNSVHMVFMAALSSGMCSSTERQVMRSNEDGIRSVFLRMLLKNLHRGFSLSEFARSFVLRRSVGSGFTNLAVALCLVFKRKRGIRRGEDTSRYCVKAKLLTRFQTSWNSK